MVESADELAQRLSAARGGSREALGQVLEACRGRLLLMAQRQLGPQLQAKAGASDLVQGTLVDAIRDFGHFQGQSEGELLQWLSRLLLNNLGDFIRQYRGTGKRQIDREVRIDEGDSSAERGGLAAGLPTPSGEVMAQEQAAALRHILEGLPGDYRRVIMLRYQEEHSFDEIGTLLGMTANAARKLLLRAIERVNRELEGPA
jgi:RNA polymerase sigma-70 factor (ECF subfamily)